MKFLEAAEIIIPAAESHIPPWVLFLHQEQLFGLGHGCHLCSPLCWCVLAGVGVPWVPVPKWHVAVAALAKAMGFLLYLFSKASMWIWGSACTAASTCASRPELWYHPLGPHGALTAAPASPERLETWAGIPGTCLSG